MQDQMGVTGGVAMQTQVQKILFERWSETLPMDLNHGTNNLGYHLDASSLLMATLASLATFLAILSSIYRHFF